MSIKLEIQNKILDSSESIKKSIENIPEIIRIIESITKSLKKGNKIILFGNGGSAADAQHIAAELVGRFGYDRKSLPAISLTTDTSVLTALGNDFGFENIFSRQCESIVSKGDVIGSIETTKAAMDLESEYEGKIKIIGKPGNSYPCGEVIALVYHDESEIKDFIEAKHLNNNVEEESVITKPARKLMEKKLSRFIFPNNILPN